MNRRLSMFMDIKLKLQYNLDRLHSHTVLTLKWNSKGKIVGTYRGLPFYTLIRPVLFNSVL